MSILPESKYVVELLTGYKEVTSPEGYITFEGGTWEVLKDEFGCEVLFDYYAAAYRELETKCPALRIFGSKIGRVKEVEMINRKKPNG
ncbi:MAG: hypothetical protein ABL876_07935 [Chitinophagaceae bacterium]